MNTSTNKRHWLDQPSFLMWLKRCFILLLALSVVAGIFVHGHPHFEIDAVFGFNAWFAFMACFAAFLVAKLVAYFLSRPDTYYDDRDD